MGESYRGELFPPEADDRLGTRRLMTLAVFFVATGYFLWTEQTPRWVPRFGASAQEWTPAS